MIHGPRDPYLSWLVLGLLACFLLGLVVGGVALAVWVGATPQ